MAFVAAPCRSILTRHPVTSTTAFSTAVATLPLCRSGLCGTPVLPRGPRAARNMPLSTLFGAGGATAAAAAAKGAPAPDFSGKDQSGRTVSLGDFKGKSAVVLFFYPKAFTPGCTRQACAFRDAADEFAGLDAAIIGVSAGSSETMASFGEKHNFKYPLLADEDNAIRTAFGVPSTFGILPGRVTYVIDKDGIIIEVFNSQLNVDEHVTVARKALEGAKAK
jgi:thioredoxin-dependent peroxiredoxin